MSMPIKYLYSVKSQTSNLRRWRVGVIGRREKVRFKAGLESDKTIRWADVQRKRIPIIRQRYTKKLDRQNTSEIVKRLRSHTHIRSAVTSIATFTFTNLLCITGWMAAYYVGSTGPTYVSSCRQAAVTLSSRKQCWILRMSAPTASTTSASLSDRYELTSSSHLHTWWENTSQNESETNHCDQLNNYK